MVGKEVVEGSSIINALQECAGKIDALKQNGIFKRFPHPSYTYFISDERANKIGHSKEPHGRRTDLQHSSPAPLKLLLTVPTGVLAEPDAHALFRHLRVRGEWFNPDPQLFGFIEALRQMMFPRPRFKSLDDPTLASLMKQLQRKRSSLHADLRPIASNLIEQIRNFPNNPERLKPFIAKSIAEFERRSALIKNDT